MNIRKQLYPLSLSVIVGASALQYGAFRNYSYFIPISILLLPFLLIELNLGINIRRLKHITIILFPITLFLVTLIGTSYAQNSYVPSVTGLYYLLLISLVLVLSSAIGYKSIEFMIKVIAIIFWIIVVLALMHGTGSYYGKGVFHNPNQAGLFFAGCATLFLWMALVYKPTNRLVVNKYFYFFLIASMLILVSRSRGSLLSLLIGNAMAALLFLSTSQGSFLKRGIIHVRPIKKGLQLVLFLSIMALLLYYFGAFAPVIDKFQKYEGEGNITNNRMHIWLTYLGGVRWWGIPHYAETYGASHGLIHGAHNNYISILMKYGVLPVIAFVSWFVVISGWLVASWKKYGDKNALFGFAVTMQLLPYWFVETGSAIFPVWVLCMALGVTIKNNIETIKPTASDL